MILDCHCHYARSFFRYRQYHMSAEELLAEMSQHGVSRAVVSSAGEFAACDNESGNREIAALVRQWPHSFFGFATINPWQRTRGLDLLRSAREELGLRGLVLHPMLQGFEANDPLVFPLVERALQWNMPVYVTGGAPLLAVPYKIGDLAGRYPEGRFIMGHAGWDFHFDVLYTLQANPNLWAETSRNELCNLEAIVRGVGADRLVFGSDYPFSSYASELEKIRLLPGVADQQKDEIFEANALRALGEPR